METVHVERLAERQNRGIEGQSEEASQSTHHADVMGFGTYGGVAFSSFVPARPASSLDAAQGLDLQEDDEGKAVMQTIAHAYVGAHAGHAHCVHHSFVVMVVRTQCYEHSIQ